MNFIARWYSVIMHADDNLELIRKICYYFLWNTFGYALILVASRRLKKEGKKIKNMDKAYDFVSTFKFSGLSIMPMQVKEEFSEFIKYIECMKPKVILEIGTANGGTLFLFTRAADPGATIISIDLHKGLFGGGYPMWKIPLYKSFSRDQQKIYLLRCDSHDPKTYEKVEQILKGRGVDLLFIDGDHRYESVKKDFRMYSGLTRPGSVIAFHDIVPRLPVDAFGVPTLWEELKGEYDYREIVKDWNQGGYGIGFIHTPKVKLD